LQNGHLLNTGLWGQWQGTYPILARWRHIM